jgi:hypothetical protein
MEMFIVLIDYHAQRAREAIVNPEQTRRQVVEEVRDVLASMDKSIVCVKRLDGNFCEDITAEICAEAGYPDAPLSPADLLAAKWDHARDLRKHAAAE